MPKGGIATLRLAQPLLIGFCTKLDWDGRAKPPQAFYRTVQLPEGQHTTVYLPSSSGIQQPVATAPCCSTAKASKNAAALQALRELRETGRLDDWLQPKK
ncbi:hypothetical protein OEZ86_001422 [Tetradesmus obliquus]|nr:hypothetical protein OEZ86_001422 [Tetradesmus obliquus]